MLLIFTRIKTVKKYSPVSGKQHCYFHYSEFVRAPRIYLLRKLQTLRISIQETFKKFTFHSFFIHADIDLNRKC